MDICLSITGCGSFHGVKARRKRGVTLSVVVVQREKMVIVFWQNRPRVCHQASDLRRAREEITGYLPSFEPCGKTCSLHAICDALRCHPPNIMSSSPFHPVLQLIRYEPLLHSETELTQLSGSRSSGYIHIVEKHRGCVLILVAYRSGETVLILSGSRKR